MPASQARHAAPWFSLRAFVIILIIVAVIIILLAGPVVAGALYEAMSRGAERAMPGMFFTGLFVLFIGIIVGVVTITFIGLGLIAAVILGWIIDNYLSPDQARPRPDHGLIMLAAMPARKTVAAPGLRGYRVSGVRWWCVAPGGNRRHGPGSWSWP
jgi:hypothetical protein